MNRIIEDNGKRYKLTKTDEKFSSCEQCDIEWEKCQLNNRYCPTFHSYKLIKPNKFIVMLKAFWYSLSDIIEMTDEQKNDPDTNQGRQGNIIRNQNPNKL